MVRALSALVLVAALAAPGVIAHAASDLPRRIGMYPPSGGTALVMLDSDVTVRVRGPIVEATVTQTFKNDTDRVTEATYIFPLPPDAAVSAMEIATGNRTIHAAIEAREKAVSRYEEAIAAGVGAALLEQERPDIFTQTVSAIPAKGEVKVTLRFDTVAHYAHGTWMLALPLVVAPRYVPGTASSRPTTGTGRAPDTDRAPDASRVTPGGAPGAGGRTDVRIEFADAVTDVTSPSHELQSASDHYTLADPKSDHDVIVRWRSKTAQQGWVESASDGGGFAAVLVEAKPAAARKSALELKLVLDRAATTRGDAEAVQRAVVRAVLGALQARDKVSVAGSDTLAAAAPDATLRALDEAWNKTAGPFDLTKVLTALRPGDSDGIVLVSDGLVADDKAAIAAATKVAASIHVIAVGPAPNRSLLTQIAEVTGGTIRFAIIGDDLALLARDVIADAASPPEPVKITWGTLGASDVVPAKLPRLGSGQALFVLARVKKAQAANARVRGDVFGFTVVKSPRAPAGATTSRGSLARRWAKLELDELVRAGNAKAITDHALRYGLVSPQTAMVAIGDEVVIEGGVKHSTPVPVSVPEGMQWQLVKKQTTVAAGRDKRAEEGKKQAQNKEKQEKNKEKEKEKAEQQAIEEDAVTKSRDIDASTPDERPIAPTSTAAAPEPGDGEGAYDEDYEDEGGRAPRMETLAMSGSSRRAVRLALSLGAGFARAGGESAPLGALGARVEFGRGALLVGLDASLWLVDGLHGQATVLSTVARRGLLDHKLEIGGGLGVTLTGDALGPAVELVLRIALPLRGVGTYLRYDGALLRGDGTSTGQNTGSFGVEARW